MNKYTAIYHEENGVTEIQRNDNNATVAKIHPTGNIEWLCVSANVHMDEELRELTEKITGSYKRQFSA